MAPFVRPAHFNQAPDAIFGCPCGKRGGYTEIVGHRHGYKLRPECNKGGMFDVDPLTNEKAVKGSPAALKSGETVNVETGEISGSLAPPIESPPPSDPDTEVPFHKPVGYEADPIDESGDEEEIARQVLSRRGITADSAGLSWWQDAHQATQQPPSNGSGSDGGGGDDGGDDDGLPPGDWKEGAPGLPVHPSQVRENVSLPVQVRLMYDYHKAHGWHFGQDTISDWVTDMLFDHWKNCLGKGIYILDREEVDVA